MPRFSLVALIARDLARIGNMKTKQTFLVLLSVLLVAAPVIRAIATDPLPSNLPRLRVVAADPTALEGASSAVFSFIREGNASSDLRLFYALSGTASNGVDYARLPDSVVIPAGQTVANLVVEPIDNGSIEMEKTVIIALEPNPAYDLTSASHATVLIGENRLNDFAGSVTVTSPTNGAVYGANAEITVMADASDPDDPPVRMSFFADDRLLGTLTKPPFAVTWRNPPGGLHILFVVARNTLGENVLSDPVRISVTNARPTVIITHPVDGAVFHVPINLVLSAEATNSNDMIRNVSFYAGDHFLGRVSRAPFSLVWSNVPPTNYVLTARAEDLSGFIATSAPVSFRVENLLPSIRWTSPMNGTRIVLPAIVTLAAEASDSDDSIAKVSFYARDQFLGSVTNPPYRLLWTNTIPGSYTLTAVAEDSFGAQQKAMTRVSVATNQPPVVYITQPETLMTFSGPTNLMIRAQAYDSDGQVRKIEIFANGQSLGVQTNNSSSLSYSLVWSNVPLANYAITAVVTDDKGAVTTSAPSYLVYGNKKVFPVAQGSLFYRPDGHTLTLGSGTLTAGYTRNPSAGRQFAEAYIEFAIPSLPAGVSNATLVMSFQQSQASATFDLSDYSADLVVNTNDFNDLTYPLASFSMDSPAGFPHFFENHFFDVTQLVRGAAGATLGFRIKLHDDPAFTGSSIGFAEFFAPRILIAAPGNLPPIVRITNPTNGTLFTSPGAITVVAEAKDVDGFLHSVQFLANDILLLEVIRPSMRSPVSITWRNVTNGTYTLTAKATDDLGLISTSAPVHITVKSPGTAAAGIGSAQNDSTNIISGSPGALTPVSLSQERLGSAEGNPKLTVQGPVGSRVVLETSSDLTSWIELAVMTNTTGTIRYTDRGAAPGRHRFYRARLLD